MWVFIFRCAHTFFIIWSNVIRSSKSWTVFSLKLAGHSQIIVLNSKCLTSREMLKNKKGNNIAGHPMSPAHINLPKFKVKNKLFPPKISIYNVTHLLNYKGRFQ